MDNVDVYVLENEGGESLPWDEQSFLSGGECKSGILSEFF
ncbi:hypothetical protein SLEP1_g7138 [Rubroshorea leprosula]|uniref:Uncharacterized protein n=1 Tax=Rubroshorea leprosula TaxID=152421 RepID=A0AAV5HXC0_9ROSI|nr:hypothetical protein SLEP1_g7138 [Rubroshorea leprosula]